MKILITAFEPFGGDSVNPALEAVKLMKDEIYGAKIMKLVVPTVFGKSIDKTIEAIEEENPDIVLNIGQAGGRFDISPERVAINIDDARIADNEGNQPIDKPIFADGESAYFTNLPIKAMVREIRDGGLPASVSNTAGSFVCNHLMYGTLYYINKNNKNIKAGFIHVPLSPDQVVNRSLPAPYMAIKDITKALELAVKAIVENKDDIVAIGGKIH